MEISVLLPVAGNSSPGEVHRSYKSIQSQTYPPKEIVIVTNQELNRNTKSAIESLVSNSSITHHYHLTQAEGLGEALQAGLKRCNKQLVARMDDDDISDRDRFKIQVKEIKNSGADIVGSYLGEFYDEPENVKRVREVPQSHQEVANKMAWRCPLNHPTVIFDRKKVISAGGYRRFPMMEDWDLWARCLNSGLKFKNVDEPLVYANAEQLVKRRGGLDYVRSEVKMAHNLRKLGIATNEDTLNHILLRLPIRMVPQRIREVLYSHFAR